MQTSSSPKVMGRTLLEWFSSLPVFTLLLLTLIIGTGEMVHGQLLKFGESMFGDQKAQVQYFMLRGDVAKPDCNANVDIEAEVQRQMSSTGTSGGGDDIDSLFGETKRDPAAVRESIIQSQQICKNKHDLYERIKEHQTPQVKAYRMLETSFFALFELGTSNRPLILLLMVGIAAITTTLG
ncbi:MAG TPA: transporter, partial [Candidatus Aquabacterium excrementipullorum]|nr:transporter [Candidatus Aquabacterium excrementipullorum]